MSIDNHAKLLVKISLSQILQTIGFRTAQSAAMDILLEILERYIHLISKSAHDFAEFSNRTQPTMDDLACSFNKHKIIISDLEEYISWVDTPEFVLAKQFQLNTGNPTFFMRTNVKRRTGKDHLGFCDDPENKEMLSRQSDEEFEFVDEHFPLMTRVSVACEEEGIRGDSEIPEVEELADVVAKKVNEEEKIVDEATLQDQDADVTKQGVVYENNSWNTMYRPKFARLYHNSKKKSDTLPSADRSLRQPEAKQISNFNKPHLDNYEKKIFLNALSALKKPTALTDADMLSSFRLKSVSAVNITDEVSQTAPLDTDKEKLPKITLSFSALKNVQDSVCPAVSDIELGQVIGFNRIKEDDNELTVEQMELMRQEELLGTEIASESGMMSGRATSKVDKLIQDQLKKHSSPQMSPAKSTPIRLKIKGDSVVESVEEKISLVIKKTGEGSSTSSMVMKQSHHNQDRPIPKLKISTKGSGGNAATSSGFSMENFFPKQDVGKNKCQVSELIDVKAIVVDDLGEDEQLAAIGNESTKDTPLTNKLSFNIVDENAIDSSMFNQQQNKQQKVLYTGNNSESLIWKPTFNTENTDSELSNEPKKQCDEVTAPPLSTFSINKPVLVSYDSNESSTRMTNPANLGSPEVSKSVVSSGGSSTKGQETSKKRKKKKEKGKDKVKEKEKEKKAKRKEREKEEKRLKKEMKRQRKLEKALAAGGCGGGGEVNAEEGGSESDGSGKEMPVLSLKISGGNIVKTDSLGPMSASASVKTVHNNEQPRLPKLKLKINASGGGGSGSGNTPAPSAKASTAETEIPIGGDPVSTDILKKENQIGLADQIVRPIKINLSLNKPKPKDQILSAEPKEQLANLLKKFNQDQKSSSLDEDEPELGEIVRPKASPSASLNSNNTSKGLGLKANPNAEHISKQQALQRQQQIQIQRKSLVSPNLVGGQMQRQQQFQQQQQQGKARPKSACSGQMMPRSQSDLLASNSGTGVEQVPKLVIKQMNKLVKSTSGIVSSPGQQHPLNNPQHQLQYPQHQQQQQQQQQQQSQQKQRPQTSSNNTNKRPSMGPSSGQSSLPRPTPSPSSSGHYVNSSNQRPKEQPGSFTSIQQQQLEKVKRQQAHHQQQQKEQQQQQKEQQQQKKKEQQQQQQQLAALATSFPGLAMSQLQSQLEAIGMLGLPIDQHLTTPFPFPFPPMDQNFAEILNAFNQFTQPPTTSKSSSTPHSLSSSSADPRRQNSATNLNLKKRKHNEFEQFPSQQQSFPHQSSNQANNRIFTKSPVTTGLSSSKSFHSANTSSNNSSISSSNFNRNKSHPVQATLQKPPQQRPVTPVTASQKNRSVTPTSQMGRVNSGNGRDDEMMPLNLSKKSSSEIKSIPRKTSKDPRSEGVNLEDDPAPRLKPTSQQSSSSLPALSANQPNPSPSSSQSTNVSSIKASNQTTSSKPLSSLSSQLIPTTTPTTTTNPPLRKSTSKLSSRPSIDKIISTLNKSNLSNASNDSPNNSFNESTTTLASTTIESSQSITNKISPTNSSVSKKPKLSPPKLVSELPTAGSIKPNRPPVLSSNQQGNSSEALGSSGAPMTIIGTVVHVVSNHQVWICPWCSKPDDTVPMIGCDSCDDWYHWHCVGINREPPANQNWYCHKCANTDNPNALIKQNEASIKKEHNLINMKKVSAHDEEADIVVEVEHPVETTDDE